MKKVMGCLIMVGLVLGFLACSNRAKDYPDRHGSLVISSLLQVPDNRTTAMQVTWEDIDPGPSYWYAPKPAPISDEPISSCDTMSIFSGDGKSVNCSIH
jgi:hypothetical protein